jgi:hypothetical protein
VNARLNVLLPIGAVALTGVWACSGTGHHRDAGQASRHPGTDASAGIVVPTARRPVDACGWVAAPEVQQFAGPLAGPPIPAGQECRYPLKLSDSLRAEMLEMRESDREVFGKAREGSNPDSVALIVSVDLSGGVTEERAIGLAGDMMAAQLPPDTSGTPGPGTGSTEKPGSVGWDVAGPSVSWPGSADAWDTSP